MGMKITLSKHDIFTLRSEMVERLNYLLNTPAANSDDPQFVAVVAEQIRVLRKFIRKLNHACVKEFGHTCNADAVCGDSLGRK